MDARALWRAAFMHWQDVVEPELHQFFGLNAMDPAFWDHPWRDVLFRVQALLSIRQSRLLSLIDSP